VLRQLPQRRRLNIGVVCFFEGLEVFEFDEGGATKLFELFGGVLYGRKGKELSAIVFFAMKRTTMTQWSRGKMFVIEMLATQRETEAKKDSRVAWE